jgi:hypothetical protein
MKKMKLVQVLSWLDENGFDEYDRNYILDRTEIYINHHENPQNVDVAKLALELSDYQFNKLTSQVPMLITIG